MGIGSSHPTRALFRLWLEREIEDIENSPLSPEAEEVRQLLSVVIKGLDALDRGRVPTIFARTEYHSGYGTGAAIPELKLEALGYVALLRQLDDPKAKVKIKSYSAEHALRLVADAYGYGQEGGETVRQWGKTFKKQYPEDLTEAKRIMRGLYYNDRIGGWPNGTEVLLRAIERAGIRYQIFRKEAKESSVKVVAKSQGKK